MNFAQDKQTSGDEDHRAGAMFGHGLGSGGHPPPLAALPPAMMPGKGVRAVRCVGCREDTLPRPEDGAPLCHRCSELLASASPETWTALLAPRWWRRRSSVFS